MIIALCTIFFSLCLFIGLKIPNLKGYFGEKRVADQFEKLALEGYKILNNVLLPTKYGTSQIDHIIISPYGIFVVETKNYKGWIFGSENSDYWTQSIYGNKISFRNPIKQNYGHILALKDVLNTYTNISYYSIIVFAGSADLVNLNVKTDVIFPDELYITIMSHRGVTQLSNSDIDIINNIVDKAARKDKKFQKVHNKSIRARTTNVDRLISNGICPKCKGSLLLRKSQYGEFLGCSNYPKCRYKASIYT